MDEKNHPILERFPEKSHDLALLIAEDPEFRAVCEDYDACINALRYWSECKEPEAEIRVSEYRTLIEELEKEVAEALER
jgi:hypothetical protein